MNKLINLHENAMNLLDKIQEEQNGISSYEESQESYRNRFQKSNPNFAYEISQGKRREKMLKRSYDKVLSEINSEFLTKTK